MVSDIPAGDGKMANLFLQTGTQETDKFVEGLYCERTIQWVEMGWGVNSSEDVRHCSVLYICKYFVDKLIGPYKRIGREGKRRPFGVCSVSIIYSLLMTVLSTYRLPGLSGCGLTLSIKLNMRALYSMSI